MAELISAKDLPMTEAESVKLLCVDGAELKLKSADGLGGGGYVLKVPAEALTMGDDGATAIITEDCTAVAQLLSRGCPVWVDISQTAVASIMGVSWLVLPVMFAAFVGNQLMMGAGFDGMTMQITCPNCSWVPGEE